MTDKTVPTHSTAPQAESRNCPCERHGSTGPVTGPPAAPAQQDASGCVLVTNIIKSLSAASSGESHLEHGPTLQPRQRPSEREIVSQPEAVNT